VTGNGTGRSWPDNRLVGFAARTPLPQALAWIDVHVSALGPETVDVEAAFGRTVTAPCVSQIDWPAADAAAVDGYAVRAIDSEGASSYNPLLLALVGASAEALPPDSAFLTAAGTLLPLGADAILPFASAQQGATRQGGAAVLEVLAPVARGVGVDRCGGGLRAGIAAIPGSRRLRPQDIALLTATGVTRIAVVRRPRVRLVVAGPKAAGHDVLTPMLCLLIARDGGCVEVSSPADAGRTALAHAMARPTTGIDLVLVAGRCGVGLDDEAPLAVTAAGGRLDAHGIAMRPGGSSGLGRMGDVPVLLLPGTPLACLAAYDMLAARAVQRLAGCLAASPYCVVDAVLDRKIVSAIGFTDVVRVCLAGRRAAPLGSAESGGLAGAVRADGFVVVPEASEGHAPYSIVRVHRYDRCAENGA